MRRSPQRQTCCAGGRLALLRGGQRKRFSTSVCTRLKSQAGERAEIHGEQNPTADILDPDFHRPVFRGRARTPGINQRWPAGGCVSSPRRCRLPPPAPGCSLGLYRHKRTDYKCTVYLRVDQRHLNLPQFVRGGWKYLQPGIHLS